MHNLHSYNLYWPKYVFTYNSRISQFQYPKHPCHRIQVFQYDQKPETRSVHTPLHLYQSLTRRQGIQEALGGGSHFTFF